MCASTGEATLGTDIWWSTLCAYMQAKESELQPLNPYGQYLSDHLRISIVDHIAISAIDLLLKFVAIDIKNG